jgi:flagellar operon protein
MEGAQMNRLEDAVQRAADKGSRDALVLMDDLAMVVSVKNRTVITVVDKESLKQNVFTNIDSAVIA